MLSAILAAINIIPGISQAVQFIVGKFYDSKVQITMAQLQCDRDKAVAYLQAISAADNARVSFLQTIAHSPILMLIVGGFAFPFIFYINKVVVWDICLKLGTTLPIRDANVIAWGNTILIGIFGTGAAMVAGNAVKSVIFGGKSKTD